MIYLFGEMVTAGEAGLGFAIVTAAGVAWKVVVDATKERRMKRDALEFGAELAELKASNVELKTDRDECMKMHAEKDGKISHLETRLDDCLKDHKESQKDREQLWAAIREMKAGPV